MTNGKEKASCNKTARPIKSKPFKNVNPLTDFRDKYVFGIKELVDKIND